MTTWVNTLYLRCARLRPGGAKPRHPLTNYLKTLTIGYHRR
jgi:hypothetical protein